MLAAQYWNAGGWLPTSAPAHSQGHSYATHLETSTITQDKDRYITNTHRQEKKHSKNTKTGTDTLTLWKGWGPCWCESILGRIAYLSSWHKQTEYSVVILDTRLNWDFAFQNHPKLPQITPEVPQIIHTGHIFFTGPNNFSSLFLPQTWVKFPIRTRVLDSYIVTVVWMGNLTNKKVELSRNPITRLLIHSKKNNQVHISSPCWCICKSKIADFTMLQSYKMYIFNGGSCLSEPRLYAGRRPNNILDVLMFIKTNQLIDSLNDWVIDMWKNENFGIFLVGLLWWQGGSIGSL